MSKRDKRRGELRNSWSLRNYLLDRHGRVRGQRFGGRKRGTSFLNARVCPSGEFSVANQCICSESITEMGYGLTKVKQLRFQVWILCIHVDSNDKQVDLYKKKRDVLGKSEA